MVISRFLRDTCKPCHCRFGKNLLIGRKPVDYLLATCYGMYGVGEVVLPHMDDKQSSKALLTYL